MSERADGLPSPIFSGGAVLLVRELYIDLFGGLVPGFCFIVLFIPAFVIPFLYSFTSPTEAKLASIDWGLIGRYQVTILIVCVVLSFVIGHILFRFDPKTPDRWSIRWLTWGKKHCECVCPEDVVGKVRPGAYEYPYGNVSGYLKSRNFRHLLKYINWEFSDFDERLTNEADEAAIRRRLQRSKHLVNILKMRTKLKNPLLLFDVVKNEGHIRLMSSVFYLGFSMALISLAGLGFGAYANVLDRAQPYQYHLLGFRMPHPEAVALPALTLFVSGIAMLSVVNFLHYQRVREIVFVLEAAHLSGVDPTEVEIARGGADPQDARP